MLKQEFQKEAESSHTLNHADLYHYLVAAEVGDIDALDTFLEKYPSQIDTPIYGEGDISDMSALMLTARAGQDEASRFLVTRGANINAISKSSRETPLMNAIRGGNESVIEYLIVRGARLDVVSAHGLTAESIAKEVGNEALHQCIRRLEKARLVEEMYLGLSEALPVSGCSLKLQIPQKK